MVLIKDSTNNYETYSINIQGNAFECSEQGCDLQLEGLNKPGKLLVNKQNFDKHYIDFNFEQNKDTPSVTFNGDYGNGYNNEIFKIKSGYLSNNEIDSNKFIANIENKKYKFKLGLIFQNSSLQKLTLLIPIVYRNNQNKFINNLYECCVKSKLNESNSKDVNILDVLPKINNQVDKSFHFKLIENDNILIVFNNPIYVDINKSKDLVNSYNGDLKSINYKKTYPWFYHKNKTENKGEEKLLTVNVDNLFKMLTNKDSIKEIESVKEKDSIKEKESVKEKESIKEKFKEGEVKEGEVKEGEVKEGEVKEGEVKEGEVKADDKEEGSTMYLILSTLLTVSILCLIALNIYFYNEHSLKILAFLSGLFLLFNNTIFTLLNYNFNEYWYIVILNIFFNILFTGLVYWTIYNNFTNMIYPHLFFILIFTFIHSNITDLVQSLYFSYKEDNSIIILIANFVLILGFILIIPCHDSFVKKIRPLLVLYLCILAIFLIQINLSKEQFDEFKEHKTIEHFTNDEKKKIAITTVIIIIMLIIMGIVYYFSKNSNEIQGRINESVQISNTQRQQTQQQSQQQQSTTTSTTNTRRRTNTRPNQRQNSTETHTNNSQNIENQPEETFKISEYNKVYDVNKDYRKIKEIVEKMRESDFNSLSVRKKEQYLRDIGRLILPLSEQEGYKIIKELASEFEFDKEKIFSISNNNNQNYNKVDEGKVKNIWKELTGEEF